MAAKVAQEPSPARVAEVLLRRDMLGPTLGHAAASVSGLLLAETLFLRYAAPALAPALAVAEASYGRQALIAALAFGTSVAGYWGVGSLFALPALFQVKSWKIQVNKSLDIRALLKALPLVVFNFVFGTAIVALVLLAALPEQAYAWGVYPSSWTLARDIITWMVVEEVLFFYIHKFLHENKRAYAAIHKLHHTWTSPVSVVAIYCHPVEHLLSNVLPMIMGPILCGSHIVVIGVFIFLGLIHTTAVHSGYWFCDDNGMHDEHHRRFNVNYGVTGILDCWYGTYQLPEGAIGKANASATANKLK
jgi:methylsterol monooxygenase